MARARTIKPSFFTNEALAECPFEARLLFIGLWTLADAEGRMEYRPKRIKAALFPFDDVDVPGLAVFLHGQKLLVLYDVDGVAYLAIPNFVKHQRPHPREATLGLPQPPVENLTYDKAGKSHGQPCKKTASCAFPSLNPSPWVGGVLGSHQESSSSSKKSTRGSASSRRRPPVTAADVTLPAGWLATVAEAAMGEWLAYKAKRGEPYRDAAYVSRLPAEFPTPESFAAAVNHSIGCNYAGLYSPTEKRHDPRSNRTRAYDPNAPAGDPL